jgi:hypothetical protein
LNTFDPTEAPSYQQALDSCKNQNATKEGGTSTFASAMGTKGTATAKATTTATTAVKSAGDRAVPGIGFLIVGMTLPIWRFTREFFVLI